MRKGVRIRAVESGYFEWPGLTQYLSATSGSFGLPDSSSILLPDSLYKEFGLSSGGEVRLLTAGTDPRGKNLTKISKLDCSGTYTTGYQELDRSFVLVDYDRGRKLSYGSTGVFLLGIRIQDPFSAELEEVRADLQRQFAGMANVYTWKEIHSVRIETFAMTKVILVIIMLLILMVAAVNISSNMIAMTSQRLPEIAILKSLGAGKHSVRDLFLAAGMISGAIGSFLGMAAGLFIALNVNPIIHGLESLLNFFRQVYNFLFGGNGIPEIKIFYSSYYLEKIPVRFEAVELVLIVVFTVMLSLVSSWFPASRAAKLKPMDVLRKH
jgi:lipoprotein-releasing system permease protein